MKNILKRISLGFLCLTGFTTVALAQQTVVTATPAAPPSTTSSTGTVIYSNQPVITATPQAPSRVVITNPTVVTTYPTYSYNNYHRPHHPFWAALHTGEPLPVDAVIGGSQDNPNAMFYVCRANYRGGVHPGKYFRGNCNISWGGRVITTQNYEVLVSRRPLTWVESSNGDIPTNAIPGGIANGNTLYICQADYQNGTHPGKLVGNNCHFSMRGQEFMTAYYNILTG